MAKATTIKVKLVSSADTGFYYVTRKNSRTMTEKLLTYGLGRGLEYYDMPAVRAIERDAAKQNYRFSALILGIVKSPPFQMKKAQGGPV